MPFLIVRQDITKMKVDAIVNAANSSLLGGGGVDGAIHRAAGPALLEECKTLGGCNTGDAKITGAGRLPCKYVIHTVGPVWHGGARGERGALESCYRRSLELAREYSCDSLAFSFISTGVYGYPKEEALEVASGTITGFLEEPDAPDMTVYLVIFDKSSFVIAKDVATDIKELIDDVGVKRLEAMDRTRSDLFSRGDKGCLVYGALPLRKMAAPAARAEAEVCDTTAPSGSLKDELDRIDESFSQCVLRLIDERGANDVEIYKKANLDRRLFSKIRSNMHYRPAKSTALALAVALELPLEDADALLNKAGYTLSNSQAQDIIVAYFIRRKNYNIFDINQALFAFDQKLLGS